MKKIDLLFDKVPMWVLALGFFAAIAITFMVLKSCGALDHTSYLVR